MSDHELVFSPTGSRCTCGFSGTIREGVAHLNVPIIRELRAAIGAGVIPSR